MNEIIRLKGYPHGIQVVIDENASMDEILQEITKKFANSEKFFGKSEKAILFEGKHFEKNEEELIVSKIKEVSSISIACVISKQPNEDIEKILLHMKEEKEEKEVKNSDRAQFFRGNVGHRDVLEMENSVIILGNVESGGKVISQKDIIVLGTLSGNAYAGVDGKPHFIAALSMDPEIIRIGEIKGRFVQKNRFIMGNKKDTPKIAYLKNGKIEFSEIDCTEELLQNLY